MRQLLARTLVSLLAGSALISALVTAVGATPAGDLQAQAAAINAQIQAKGATVAALGEQLNAAQIRVDAAKAQIGQLEAIVQQRAAVLYQTKGNGSVFDLSATNALDLVVRSKYTSIIDGRDRQLIDQLKAAKHSLSQQRVALSAAKTEADAAAAQEQRLLAQVTGQLAVAVAQQQQQQQQAAVLASVKVVTSAQPSAAPASASGTPNWAGPAPAGGAAAAVAFARAQVGKPYKYAAAGPDAYDCSGLTMRAWQAGGVSMPHFSGAQYSMFPKVPMNQLQPGDLVFPSDPNAHVGIYVGGGMMVHATHTGDFIREDPISQPGLVMTSAVRP